MNRPVTDNRFNYIIKLYNRCEQMQVLPRAGGMEEQDEKIMIYFDVIREIYNKYKMEQIEREKKFSEARTKRRR